MADLKYRTFTGACKICGAEFSYEHATGRHPTMCSDECRKTSSLRREASKPRLKCAVNGCDKDARPGKQPICAMHYHRKYRTGTTHRDAPAHRWLNKCDGYYVNISASHPLAGKRGVVREHRAVAYDKYGEGPHDCYWCGKELEWERICVDHLNSIKQDNRPENLVVSCNGCNGARAKMMAFISRSLPEVRQNLREMIEEALEHSEPSKEAQR